MTVEQPALFRHYACRTPDCEGYGQEVSVSGQYIGAMAYTWPVPLCAGCQCEPHLIRHVSYTQPANR